MHLTFWILAALELAVITSVAWSCGMLVRHRGVRVNYTRKVVFFSMFLVPLLGSQLCPFPAVDPLQKMLRSILFFLLVMLFTQPIRRRVPFLETLFLAIDRPEDRPHTLWWLLSQLAAGYAVLLILLAWFHREGHPELALALVLVHGLGDGLAEPVGVRFGRHRYRARALCGSLTYTRSLEGSACVFVAGLLTVLVFQESFTPLQFAWALLVFPLSASLGEAFSPHTWDTPLMHATGGLSLWLVKTLA